MIERGMPTRVQDCQFSVAVELSEPSTALATSMEMEQLTACFNDAVIVRGNQVDAAAAPQTANMEMPPARADLEELIARFVEVTVCDEPVQGEVACVVRVLLPDGHVFDKVFGTARPVAALFRYCGSPFRLVRFAGDASKEIPPRGDASLQDLPLDRCVIYVVFSP